ncbi:MAG: HEPN domain-containing protein [Deltaproteobacteria bacterium]|nr:HEPN domain-containing protein [Deltaproteobacteria bacterium]
MTIQPDDFLKLARELAQGEEEIHWRCAASRAYYAAYHTCLPLGNRFPPSKKDIGSHQKLILGLKESPDSAIRALGNRLSSLRDLRASSDYKLGDSFEKNDSHRAVKEAEEILSRHAKAAGKYPP